MAPGASLPAPREGSVFFEQGGRFSLSWLQPSGWRAVWETVLDPAGKKPTPLELG